MNILIGLLLIGTIIFFATLISDNRKKSFYLPQELRPYVSKNPLTPTEALLYHRLIKTLPEYVVLAQVQLSSFLKVDETQTNYQNYLKWFGYISQQSVDFLICRKDFSIVVAIELDDKSHNSANAIERDNKKTNNLDAAKVPLIRWHAERMPDTEMIKNELLKYTQEAVVIPVEEPEWLVDERPSFLKSEPDIKKSIFVNIIVWFAVAIIVIAALNVINGKIANISQSNSSKHQPPFNEFQSQTSVSPLHNIVERQQQERTRMQAQQELRKQQELIEKQNQQRLMIEQETALKEDAWNHYTIYKKTVECSKVDGTVTCGNKVERNRQQFEYEWAHQRYKFGRTAN